MTWVRWSSSHFSSFQTLMLHWCWLKLVVQKVCNKKIVIKVINKQTNKAPAKFENSKSIPWWVEGSVELLHILTFMRPSSASSKSSVILPWLKHGLSKVCWKWFHICVKRSSLEQSLCDLWPIRDVFVKVTTIFKCVEKLNSLWKPLIQQRLLSSWVARASKSPWSRPTISTTSSMLGPKAAQTFANAPFAPVTSWYCICLSIVYPCYIQLQCQEPN